MSEIERADPGAHAGETAPLLPSSSSSSNTTITSTQPGLLRTAVPFLIILTVVEFAAALVAAGVAALVEGSLCRTRFPDVTQPYGDPRCKHEAVQADLAWIIGMENTISVIPGLLMSIPYGVVADRYGPNIVLGLVWVGQFLSEGGHLLVCLNPQIFNVRWIYASSCMTLIGGGGATYVAMRYLVGASLVDEKNRTTLFFYIQAYSTSIAFLTGPVVYFVMSRGGPVAAQTVGVALLGLMAIPGFAMPRRLRNTPAPSSSSSSSSSSPPTSIRARVADVVASAATTLRLVFLGPDLLLTLLLGSVVFTTLGAYETTFRLQYATKRFGWTWAQAGLLSSVASAANLSTLVLVLPALSWLLLRRGGPALSKDLWLARGSGAVQVLGSFLTALAPTGPAFVFAVALYECQRGYMPSIVSVIIAVAERAGVTQQSTVYACVSTMSATGSMLAGPVMASAFRVGLEWGQSWYGLPFLAAGVLQLCTFLILIFVRQK
ncbi:Major facilitator superfamily transporter [Cordyceps fumosorosea ARSEF 2679]|uniref:Major facilitator superfamily transporter n=1 Tax=Cordyceps fumosorosea (strain ARSEF 2679) TaxID=1081104 RepID=A0A167MR69_CORFA|nr:Major facilitator superfamily transporter [Cordyceps fumosorosea ARSEF 2679]OAA54664.1 Major facilitator superfamily transporter [Cordyceps fumosorosea ARSEF 2679]